MPFTKLLHSCFGVESEAAVFPVRCGVNRRLIDLQISRSFPPDDGRLGVIEQFNFLLVEQSLRSEELMCAARRVLGATVRSSWFASLISRAARNIHLTTSTWKITGGDRSRSA
jgi:hypothetical protein